MNPLLIGIPGFLLGWVLSYVFAEISAKYLNVEQAGRLALEARKIRLRLFLNLGALTLVFVPLRLISVRLGETIFPWFMLGIIVFYGRFHWRVWRLLAGIGTPAPHRRLYGASLVAGFLAIALFAGACASTVFVPKEWIEHSRPVER